MRDTPTYSRMSFATLYGTASNGKTKEWSIGITALDDGTAQITTSYGYEDGKKQTQTRIVLTGKNIGKKNATSAFEQATAEARTAWTKKTEENYAPRGAAASACASAAASVAASAACSAVSRSKEIDQEVPLPMLAHDYHKSAKKIVYPCYVQPKLDGTRCVGIPQRGLFSRRRKAYPHLEHLRAELDRLPSQMMLDGELYSDVLSFQTIVGMVKKETLSAAEEKEQLGIQFHVYDLVDAHTTFSERHTALRALFDTHAFEYLVLVDTQQAANEAAMKTQHDAYVAAGYEGIMLRNPKGAYVHRRSYDLQKYKEFCSEEFKVTGFEEGDGAEKGCVIWVCQTDEGKSFRCRPAGTREDRQADFQRGEDFVGQLLTVKFQELTDDGIPRFPVGIAFRDYE